MPDKGRSVNARRPPKVGLDPTIAEWEAAWQALYPGRRSPETQRNYRYQCATFVRRVRAGAWRVVASEAPCGACLVVADA
jgi:hypothetical protein